MQQIPSNLIQDSKEQLGNRAIDIMKLDLKEYSSHTDKSLCPFHSEDTPSFSWDNTRNSFKCFGCDESMDIFRYLQDFEGMTFIESVQKVFSLTGIDYDFDMSDEDIKKQKITIQTRKNNTERLTSEFIEYQNNLINEQPVYKILTDDWGFNNSTIEKYKLGYAEEGYYSNRIVIPYLNRMGEVIYATGRDTTGSSDIKYKRERNNITENGEDIRLYPMTPLFNGQALSNYKDDVLVVEGEKDCITYYRKAIKQ